MTGPSYDSAAGRGLSGYGRAPATVRRPESANLADILERVLDKGIVIAGDIQVNLLDIELLTIKLRLVIASVDRAKEMGIDWWEHDPTLSSGSRSSQDELADENRRLRERVAALESGGEPHEEPQEEPHEEPYAEPHEAPYQERYDDRYDDLPDDRRDRRDRQDGYERRERRSRRPEGHGRD
jgi:hypothetical protein